MVIDIAGVSVPDWVALAPTFAFVGAAMLTFLVDTIEPEPGTSSNTVLAGVAEDAGAVALSPIVDRWGSLGSVGSAGGEGAPEAASMAAM